MQIHIDEWVRHRNDDHDHGKNIGIDDVTPAVGIKPGASFDYDREVEGLRALDRYTIQFKLRDTRPRFLYSLADAGSLGAVAREVVEKYGDKIMEHPAPSSRPSVSSATASASTSAIPIRRSSKPRLPRSGGWFQRSFDRAAGASAQFRLRKC